LYLSEVGEALGSTSDIGAGLRARQSASCGLLGLSTRQLGGLRFHVYEQLCDRSPLSPRRSTDDRLEIQIVGFGAAITMPQP
jgi:hypothetical protein